jgi:hypothetical protein
MGRQDEQRESGYYVDSTDWPAIAYPAEYPSHEELYTSLDQFDAVYEAAMRGLARVVVHRGEAAPTSADSPSAPPAEVRTST